MKISPISLSGQILKTEIRYKSISKCSKLDIIIVVVVVVVVVTVAVFDNLQVLHITIMSVSPYNVSTFHLSGFIDERQTELHVLCYRASITMFRQQSVSQCEMSIT